jgi:translation initiation factor IF-3
LISEFLLKGREVLAVYLMLKDRETELDETLLQLLDRLERGLYQELTIDEFESIRERYHDER